MPYLFVDQNGTQALHEYDDQSHAITNVGLTFYRQNVWQEGLSASQNWKKCMTLLSGCS